MTPRRTNAAGSASAIAPGIGIIVHSHLRWDFVWQRPQQLLSRLATTNPVLFVEEPLMLDDVSTPVLHLTTPHPGVTRAVPHLPAKPDYGYDDAIVVVRRLIESLLASPDVGSRFARVV